MNRRFVLACGLAITLLSGCAGDWGVKYADAPDPSVARGWRVSTVSVIVPDSLTVSEANTYAPNADIVWHGEAYGDRRAQVGAIVRDGLTRGVQGLGGSRAVTLKAQVIQFHAVTPIALDNAPSAVHNIKYILQVLDADSGRPLTEPELVSADLEADVGTAAVIAAIEGNTQRARIVRHLAAVTAGWLGSGPDQRRTFRSMGR